MPAHTDPTGPQAMPTADALHALWAALYEATDDQARDLADILRLSAEGPPLRADEVIATPVDLPAERRLAYWTLTLALLSQGITWRPIYAGSSGHPLATLQDRLRVARFLISAIYAESLGHTLATLVIGRDWDRISSTAQSLRAAAASRSTSEPRP
jgi:hypothetical protein